MRRALTSLALAVLTTAAACGDDGGGGQTTQTTTAPVRGGTLVVAIGADPGSLNPAVTSANAVHQSAELMFNGLVGFDTEGSLAPELAASWRVEGGGTAYTFTLRDGVKWHDGRPFTSDDVKFSFEKALLPFHSRARASMGPTAAGVTVETPDPRTVVFRFRQPYAPLLQQLNVTEAPIIPRHVFEGCADISTVAGCPANKNPIGTGPFKLASYTIQEVRMVRNPEYFRPGLPYLDEVVQRVIPQAGGTDVAALEKGEVDWLWFTPGPDTARLRGDRNIVLAPAARGPGGGNCVLTVVYNLKPPAGRTSFFGDLRVRQGVAHAINRQQAVDQVLFGQGQVAAAPISSAIGFAHAKGLPLPGFDLARARTLLDQAGWKAGSGGTRVAQGVQGVPDGTEFSIDFAHQPGIQATYGETIKTQLREVGISVTTKQMDNATFGRTTFGERAFDTSVISYCNESDPQIGVRRQYHSSQIGTTPFSNGAAYSKPEMDTLWDQAGSEVDPAKRTVLYRRIQELAVADLPYFWLAETFNLRAYRAACTGFNIQNTGLFAEGASCRR